MEEQLSFIRRNKEIALLENSLKKVSSQKELQVQFITGEAGTGKSVLIQTFLNDIKETERIAAYLPNTIFRINLLKKYLSN